MQDKEYNNEMNYAENGGRIEEITPPAEQSTEAAAEVHTGGQEQAYVNQNGYEQPAADQTYNGQPYDQTYGQPVDQTYGQPVEQTYGQPVDQTYGQPVDQTYGQPVDQTYGQPYDPSCQAPQNAGYDQGSYGYQPQDQQYYYQNGQGAGPQEYYQYQQNSFRSDYDEDPEERQQREAKEQWRAARAKAKEEREAKRAAGRENNGSDGNGSGKRRWTTVIASALVFGLIAGLTTFGVNAGMKAAFKDKTSVEAGAEKTQTLPGDTQENTIYGGAAQVTPTATTTGSEMTVADVAAAAMPSMVTISTISVVEMRDWFGGSQQYEAEGAGSGVIIGSNDTELLIATNNHVIEGAEKLSVGFIDESAVEGYVKGRDKNTDLAVVGVKLENIPEETKNVISVIKIGDSDQLVLGEQVVAIGNSLGNGQSVTSGYVSAVGRSLELSDGQGNSWESTDLIQTSAQINSGNSGGALLNMRGELVGINEAKISGNTNGAVAEGVGFAISMKKAEPILTQMMNLTTRQAVDPKNAAYMGVYCVNVGSETTEMYGVPTGVYFQSIEPGSAAEKAGAIAGDVLVKLDGRTIYDYDELSTELGYYKAGETVEMVVMRANNGVYEEVKLNITFDPVPSTAQ